MNLLELDIHFLLSSDIGTPGSEVFKLEPGLIPLAPLVLRPLGLEAYYLLSWAFSLQMEEHGTSQPPQLCESISHNKSLSMFLWRSMAMCVL